MEKRYAFTSQGSALVCTMGSTLIFSLFTYNYTMKKLFIISSSLIMLLILSGCSGKPDHHPKNPNYSIKKPKVKYKPSKKNLSKMITQLQGSPYVWAEEGPNYFDCSGFTYYLYGSMGITIPRVARDQAKVGKRVSPNKLQYGDLIFFATNKRKKRKITHVGMYLGNGWFTHASTIKHEVIYSNLFTSKYYKNRLRVCRRYLPTKQSNILKPNRQIWEQPATIKPKIKVKDQKKAVVIKAPMQEISSTGNFYVQVGSYLGQPESSVVQRIRKRNLHYRIIQYTQGSQVISKLLVGPYTLKSQARDILYSVTQYIASDAFIAEIR